MKKTLINILALFFIFGFIAFIFPNTSKSAEGMFSTNVEYEEAIVGKKPFVLIFYAPWCSACRDLNSYFGSLKNIYTDKFDFVAVNVEEYYYREVVREYRINVYPTVYIINPVNKKRIKLERKDYINANALKKALGEYLKDYNKK